jgi:hypothetical protein
LNRRAPASRLAAIALDAVLLPAAAGLLPAEGVPFCIPVDSVYGKTCEQAEMVGSVFSLFRVRICIPPPIPCRQ